SVRSGTTANTSRGAVTGRSVGAPATPPPAPPISSAAISAIVENEAPTQSYAKIYNDSRVGASVDSFVDELEHRFRRATSGLKGERVVGVVVAYGGEVAWSDIFASAGLFDHYWS